VQALSKCDIGLRLAQTDSISRISRAFKILLVTLFLVTNFSFPQESDELMSEASQHYRNNEYDLAAENYEKLIDRGYEGTALFYNLGNSYFKLGKIGYAILNYERALKVSPSDEDVKHNLTFAYLNTSDRIEPLPKFFLFEWWETLLSSFSVNGWSYFTYAVYILLLVQIAAYFFARSIVQQKIILLSSLAVVVVFVLSVSMLIVKINREETHIEGIIVEQSVTVKTSPDLKSTDAFLIHEGLKVKLEDNLDDWIKIRLADGKVGWVEKNLVERI
jgi:tetratricopeptide (TPR) repeat protein